ncbi:formyltetrahydrofolate deformylase [Glutamicibacter sp.]|jgi:formyltetrahydrofolate deformylase|uniref:formyltetrahydrofolate deformylase n=1 Tax=Glutamicibacter sp. TaxID=1931995 RepID=UPI002B46797F|nr:formyltetrahydrofolate deformylase [Glutamicibacter sp.]HJX79300.1 formyltetrahydrofolate deformylase [Glutamicibacter sp.]
MTEPNNIYVLTFTCAERSGIVHAVTGLLLKHQGDIRELKQHDDQRSGTLFMRIEFEICNEPDTTQDIAGLEASLEELAQEYQAQWGMRAAGKKKRVVVMVSKFGHCLHDLLFRARMGELPVEIAAVVSNHPDHRQQVEWNGIPFFHIPVTAETKPEAETKLMELVDRFDIDLVVLARYMQVLSDDLTRKLTGRAINIHHSFLPSFKGAKPYHQAFERGVKTVGATAHYVNSELDEGPIIAQQVQEVDHSYGPENLVAAGRDTECKALSDAVRWHCEDRVFLNGSRTVVLR